MNNLWISFWIAIGLTIELILLTIVYKLGHARGEDAAAPYIHDLYRRNKKLDRELDFLKAEADNLHRLLDSKIKAIVPTPFSRIAAVHAQQIQEDTRILRHLLDSAKVASFPQNMKAGGVQIIDGDPPLINIEPTVFAPASHIRGLNSAGGRIVARCNDPDCRYCYENFWKPATRHETCGDPNCEQCRTRG
jgi:hypothetical protein